MKILFLTDNFPPEHNAPATRTFEHAREWIRAGHSVTVITTAPNFPEGKLISGYSNRWYQRETMSGIEVVRVKSYLTANQGRIRRTLDYVSFMITGAIAALFEKRPDVLVTTSPQLFCAMAGWIVSGIRRLPWVFELRDLWPASIVAVGAMRKSLAIRWLERLELSMYRDADAVVSVTRAFRRNLIRRGIRGSKIHIVMNGVDLSRYGPRPKDQDLVEQLQIDGKFVVGYLGTHGMAHALDKVIDAVTLLRHREDIVFLFVGAGAKRAQLEATVAERGLTNVRLLPVQNKEMMPRLWSVHDVALIPLRDAPLFKTVIPSKMFEAMGMGVPILMSVPEGEAIQLVKETGSGVVVPPENPQALADEVERLAAQPLEMRAMGEAGARAAVRFTREESAGRMVELFARAVEGEPLALRVRPVNGDGARARGPAESGNGAVGELPVLIHEAPEVRR